MNVRTIALRVACALAASLPGTPALAVLCPPAAYQIDESFNSIATRDDATTMRGWGVNPDPPGNALTLPSRNINLAIFQGTLGTRVVAIGAANLDADAGGLDDLVALVRHVNEPKVDGVYPANSCRLEYFRNKGFGAGGHLGFDPAVPLFTYAGNSLKPDVCSEEGAHILGGDIDGDGMDDVALIVVEDTYSSGRPPLDVNNQRSVYLWRNCPDSASASAGTGNCPALSRSPGTAPTFSAIQHTLKDHPDSYRFHWAADSAALVNWNDDTATYSGIHNKNREDLVLVKSQDNTHKVYLYYACELADSSNCGNSDDFGNSHGFGWSANPGNNVPSRVELISNASFATPSASASRLVPLRNNSCPPSVSRGMTMVIPADFDKDGDTDLALGSMSEAKIIRYKNSGNKNNFSTSQSVTIPFPGGGPAYGVAFDYNLDGYPDIAVARDSEGCNASDGQIWVLQNDGNGNFPSAPVAVADLGNDVDFLVRLDANGDGSLDVLGGRAIAGSPYVLILPAAGTVYHASGVAVSNSLTTSLDPTTKTIVDVTVSELTFLSGNPMPAKFEMSVSNNDGQTWELVLAKELPSPLGSGPLAHAFKSYGARLRWKVEMEYEENLTGSLAPYAPGATQSPQLDALRLDYSVIEEPFNVSSSGVSLGILRPGASNERQILYRAYTQIPSFTGQVDALEITDCDTFTGPVEDQTCTAFPWMPGSINTEAAREQLMNRNGSNRVLYSAFAATGTQVDDLVGTPGSGIGTTLTTQQRTLFAVTSEVSPDSFFEFFRNGAVLGTGAGQPKMYDMGHSTPVFVGPPGGQRLGNGQAANLSFFDPRRDLGYQEWIDEGTSTNRKPMVYVGSNDGVLHAFDALTGVEDWGFIPNNLAAKIRDQRSGSNQYVHGFFIDGPVVPRDIYDHYASKWRTILITGQARGIGASGENYFFAVDVTDPSVPKPLWEFSDPWERNFGTCDGDPCGWVVSSSCSTPSCTAAACSATRTTLSDTAFAGASQIVVTSGSSFPSSGLIEIDRDGPLYAETFKFQKASSTVFNLYNDAGATSTLTWDHAAGDSVDLFTDQVFREQGDKIVIEAEGWRYHQSLSSPNEFQTSTTTRAGTGHTGWGYLATSPSGTNCSDNVTTCGAALRYTVRVRNPGVWDVYAHVWYDGSGQDSFQWGWENAWVQRNRHTVSYDTWQMVNTLSFASNNPVTARVTTLFPGTYTFNLWLREGAAYFDKFILVPQGSAAPSGTLAGTCEDVCVPGLCTSTTAYVCTPAIANASTQDWPECGAGLKCCDVAGDPDAHFCAPTAEPCGAAESVLGETWSPPQVGKFLVAGVERYLVIFGSGYNNRGHFNTGRSIYAVDAINGALVGRWDLNDLVLSGSNLIDIENTVPGGVTLVDLDSCEGYPPAPGCGLIDRIYVGDLEGRLWKIDTTEDGLFSGGLISHTNWPSCVVFDAGDYNNNGARDWAPIITKPAVAVVDAGMPHIFFGTGGDDRADASVTYRFYSVRDDDVSGASACGAGVTQHENNLNIDDGEWVIGDGRKNDGNPATSGTALASAGSEGAAGDRYWSDPIIVNGVMVVFVSLQGLIEAANPCQTLEGTSTAYGYAIRTYKDNNNVVHHPGDRLLYLTGLNKIRTAAIVRGLGEGQSFNAYGTAGVATNIPLRKAPATQVFVQEVGETGTPAGSPNVKVLDGGGFGLGGVAAKNIYKILRWREVPL